MNGYSQLIHKPLRHNRSRLWLILRPKLSTHVDHAQPIDVLVRVDPLDETFLQRGS